MNDPWSATGTAKTGIEVTLPVAWCELRDDFRHFRADRIVACHETGDATWHPVEGREAWRYAWKPEGSGTRTILCRVVDDSGNLEAPAAGVTVTVSEMD